MRSAAPRDAVDRTRRPIHRDLKNIIRERRTKTGESYTAARIHVMRERANRLGLAGEGSPAPESARRASGTIPDARIDATKLGLEPLPLVGGELDDVASCTEPYRSPDPYAPLWNKLTATPRASFEYDGIAWGALPGWGLDENPTCDAAELAQAGDSNAARTILMDVLCADLRCLDAHAQLGNLEFDDSPHRAIVHYEIGIRTGELSLPVGFNGLLAWGMTYNRPFLRCLHGYGLCLWRLGRFVEAQRVFERMLALNPTDNQGVRFCWEDVRQRRTWEEMQEPQSVGKDPSTIVDPD